MNEIDLIGKKFNLLTVIKKTETKSRKGLLWLCQCDCGGTKEIAYYDMRKGLAKSCGCIRKGGSQKGSNRNVKKSPKPTLMTEKEYDTMIRRIRPRKIICKVA